MNDRELVIGCGPVGRAVLRRLRNQGISAVGASRDRPEGPIGEWRALDASRSDQVADVARSFSTVYLCAAPPLTLWTTEFHPLVKGVLDGLKDSGATLVFASNLYAYGKQDAPLTEDSQELATGPKGSLRGRLDREVLAASGLSTAVVRASSFFGPQVPSSRAGSAELLALKEGRPIPALGSVDQPHSMTYIDDFARAMVRIAHRPDAHGRVWHAPMQPPLTQRELLERFGREIGAEPTFRLAGPFLLRMLGLFNADMRALRETFHSHAEPFIAESTRYDEAFDDAPTDLDTAIKETLRSNGLA